MLRDLSERRKAVLFAVALLVTIAGVYGFVRAIQPPPVPRAAVTAVTLLVETPWWTIRYSAANTTNNSAFGLLMEASSHLGFSVRYTQYTIPQGVFVTAINGTANGQSGLYWQFWVSGAYGSAAADLVQIHGGDTVLWNFTASQE